MPFFCTYTTQTATLVNAGLPTAFVQFNLTDGAPGCTLAGSNPALLTRYAIDQTYVDWGTSHFNPADGLHGPAPLVGWASNQRISIPVGVDILSIKDFMAAGAVSMLVVDASGANPTLITFTVPTANSASFSVNADSSVLTVLTGSLGTGPGPLTYTVDAGPSHGSLSGATPNVTYTPTPGYVGSDSFTFFVNDGAMDSTVDGVISLTVLMVITSVVPPYGVIAGGTAVTVHGNGFDSGTTFTFDGLAATSVVVAGDGQSATMVTPAHAVGPVNVVAHRSTGETATLVNGYTYYLTPNLASSPPFQTATQWALHRLDLTPRREGPAGDGPATVTP